MTVYPLFITCAKGLDYLLADELTALGFASKKTAMNGVHGEADLATLYNIVLHSRLANRVLLKLHSGNASNAKNLYTTAKACDWFSHFSAKRSLSIRFKGKSTSIRNAMFGVQTIKDAIVDKAREQFDSRPDIDKDNPDIRISAYLKHGEVDLYLDVSGLSLHQRHYRQRAGAAPIKETVAAALLYRMGFDKKAHQDYGLIDFCCGSGTLLIEAAMMAYHLPPGLIRQDYKFSHWLAHDEALWHSLRLKARKQHLDAKETPLAPILGFDNDPRMVRIAISNIQAAGLQDLIKVSTQSLETLKRPEGLTRGLVISNPPYGERLSEMNALIPLYQAMGQTLSSQFISFDAAILTSDMMLSKAIGLRAYKRYPFNNGPLECMLSCFKVDENNHYKISKEGDFSDTQQTLFNRLKKNSKQLKKYLADNEITCYRLYDADMPEYNVAIDVYNNYCHVQEYAPPKTIDPTKAQNRLLDVMQVLPQFLEIPSKNVILKQRKQQKGKEQYNRQASTEQRFIVREGNIQCYVNLNDFLDTGLFLDHRPLRCQFETIGEKKRFLNLFCYTAVASLHAASNGAITTNVDMSNTYLGWAKDNFRQNNFTINNHEFIQKDCLVWLADNQERYDVIFLDPPSFSNSKRMQDTLDIQRDHASLIHLAMRALEKNGTLYFSCNLKGFKLDLVIEEKFNVIDITRRTTPMDFKKSKHSHHCFEITTK